MSRPEDELARKLVQYLDDGAGQLEPRVRERLAAARRTALSHYREPSPALSGLAWVGHAVAWLHGARLLAAGAALVVVAAGIFYWQSPGPANGLAEIDAYLLTDELPINAYLDKGFDSWLKRSSR